MQHNANKAEQERQKEEQQKAARQIAAQRAAAQRAANQRAADVQRANAQAQAARAFQEDAQRNAQQHWDRKQELEDELRRQAELDEAYRHAREERIKNGMQKY